MNKRITADDINTALLAMDKKKGKWEKEHPGESMKLCPKCGNTGLVRRVFDEYENEVFGDDALKPGTYDYYEPCICVKGEITQTYKNNKKFASVPGLYIDATFDNFLTNIYSRVESKQLATMAKNDAIRYVNNIDIALKVGMGLYIYSDAKGSGKSRLASTICNELIKRDVRNKFASASQILSEIQDSWNDQNQSETKVIKKYIEPNILIIDDLGARGNKKWIDDKFQYLFETRYAHNKITIVTSNYKINSLPFDDNRIADRLSDVDRFHLIKMPNESLRPINRRGGGGDPFYELFSKKDKEV